MVLNAGNGRSLRMEGLNTEGWAFKKIKEFIGETVPVKGYYITKGKFGDQCVVCGNGVLINMPDRAVEEFESIFADETNKNLLLAGKISLKNIKVLDTKSGTTTGYDIDADVE